MLIEQTATHQIHNLRAHPFARMMDEHYPQRKAAGDGSSQITSLKETKLRLLVELMLECVSETPTERL